MKRIIQRREAMASMVAATAAGWLSLGASLPSSDAATGTPAKTGLGLVIYNASLRRSWMQQQSPTFDLFEPLTFLQHCQQAGAGGMQAVLGVLERDRARALRAFAEQHELFIDAIVRPPDSAADCSRFAAEIQTAFDVGALAARTVIMPGRRYEQFATREAFRAAEAQGRRMLEWAAPIVERIGVPLAVENHKDQRIDERVALLEHLSSEFIGACVDTGNSVALLEDPYEVVEALAPYALTVHLKDQAVQACDDGFWLGDIPLGQGCFDLERMIAALRQAKPSVRFVLELLTRDPLLVPCLTDAYWVTMPSVPARDLARTMRMVRQHPARELQDVRSRPLETQVEMEDANVAASLRYAHEHLAL